MSVEVSVKVGAGGSESYVLYEKGAEEVIVRFVSEIVLFGKAESVCGVKA
jgi:ABC-type thiamine transport system substrate-binding protein